MAGMPTTLHHLRSVYPCCALDLCKLAPKPVLQQRHGTWKGHRNCQRHPRKILQRVNQISPLAGASCSSAGSHGAEPGLSLHLPNVLSATEANILALDTVMGWNLRTSRLLAGVQPLPLTAELTGWISKAAAMVSGGSDISGVLCPWLPNTAAIQQLVSQGFKVVGLECSATAMGRACLELGMGPEERGVHDGWERHRVMHGAQQQQQQQQRSQLGTSVRQPRHWQQEWQLRLSQSQEGEGASINDTSNERDNHNPGNEDTLAAPSLKPTPAAAATGTVTATQPMTPPPSTDPPQRARPVNEDLYLYRGNPYNLTPPVLSLVPFALHAVWDAWGLMVTPPELLPRYASVWAELLPRGGVWIAPACMLQPPILEMSIRTDGNSTAVKTPPSTIQMPSPALNGKGLLHAHHHQEVLIPSLARAGFAVEVLALHSPSGKEGSFARDLASEDALENLEAFLRDCAPGQRSASGGHELRLVLLRMERTAS